MNYDMQAVCDAFFFDYPRPSASTSRCARTTARRTSDHGELKTVVRRALQETVAAGGLLGGSSGELTSAADHLRT